MHSGVVASIWFVVGIIVASKFYENYSHTNQFCSVLGADGSPTEKLSPLINNYPLGELFCLLGWYVTQLPEVSSLVTLSGWLIIAHGIGTWLCGYFPMDADPYIEKPTFNCQVHTLSGGVMLLSLLIAPVLIAISPTTELNTANFRWFSLFSVVLCLVFSMLLSRAYKLKKNAGTYQRLSYGVQLLWLGCFSLVLSLNGN